MMNSKIYLARHSPSLHHSKSKTSKKQAMKKVGSISLSFIEPQGDFSDLGFVAVFKKFGSGSET